MVTVFREYGRLKYDIDHIASLRSLLYGERIMDEQTAEMSELVEATRMLLFVFKICPGADFLLDCAPYSMKEGLPAGEDCTAAADKVFVVLIIISCIIGIRMFVR